MSGSEPCCGEGLDVLFRFTDHTGVYYNDSKPQAPKRDMWIKLEPKKQGGKKIQKSKNTRTDKQIKGNDRVNVAQLFCGLSSLEQRQGDL